MFGQVIQECYIIPVPTLFKKSVFDSIEFKNKLHNSLILSKERKVLFLKDVHTTVHAQIHV